MKELIYKINHEENFDKAQGMLKMLNEIYGTKYGFLAKRVVRFENPDGTVAEKYANCHDVWCELENEASRTLSPASNLGGIHHGPHYRENPEAAQRY